VVHSWDEVQASGRREVAEIPDSSKPAQRPFQKWLMGGVNHPQSGRGGQLPSVRLHREEKSEVVETSLAGLHSWLSTRMGGNDVLRMISSACVSGLHRNHSRGRARRRWRTIQQANKQRIWRFSRPRRAFRGWSKRRQCGSVFSPVE